MGGEALIGADLEVDTSASNAAIRADVPEEVSNRSRSRCVRCTYLDDPMVLLGPLNTTVPPLPCSINQTFDGVVLVAGTSVVLVCLEPAALGTLDPYTINWLASASNEYARRSSDGGERAVVRLWNPSAGLASFPYGWWACLVRRLEPLVAVSKVTAVLYMDWSV